MLFDRRHISVTRFLVTQQIINYTTPSSSSSSTRMPKVTTQQDNIDDTNVATGVGNEEEDDQNMEAELEVMRQRMKEMEEEQQKIQMMQSQLEKDLGSVDEAKEEVDARSVYVGNVDYEASAEELQSHFIDCGAVNRVTIPTDRFSSPKGFAYIEFLEKEAVEQAVLLDGSEFKNRAIKVVPKRTNVPGMAITNRGRGSAPYRGRGGFAPPFRGGRGRGRGGFAPRGRGRGGYHPYGS
jgi:polyadenylate-binding protein 2